MSDEFDQDRDQAPTPRHRQDARREGDVARSADLSGAMLLFGVLLALYALGPRMFESWRQVTLALFAPQILSQDAAQLPATLQELGWHLAGGLLPLLMAVLGIALLANLGQTGFIFAPGKLALRPDTVNPFTGFGRIFGSGRTYFGLLMNLAKLAVVGVVAWLAIRSELPRIALLQTLEVGQAAALGAWIVFTIGLKIAGALLLLGLADYGYQRWRHEQRLKMTRRQVKDEAKRMDGDPRIKSRRQQITRGRAAGRSNSRARQAVH